MSVSDNRHRFRRPAGFTLVELMVVIVILVLLIGILLPALHSARIKSMKTTNQAQLSSIAKACESYQTSYQGKAPGYFNDIKYGSDPGTDPDGIANDSSYYQNATANEGLVLSLMGGVVRNPTSTNGPTIGTAFSNQADIADMMGHDDDGNDQQIDIDAIGLGPQSPSGRQYGAFYTPKENELAVITGTTGDDNNMPEFVDGGGGQPILYMRATRSDAANSVPVGWDGGGANHETYLRATVADYVHATALKSAKGGTVNQSELSLFSDTKAGSAAAANDQLAWWTIQPSASDLSGTSANNANEDDDVVKGAFVLLASGPDETYCDDLQNDDSPIDIIGDLKNFDDVAVSGGLQ